MKTLLDFKGSLLHKPVDFSGVKVSALLSEYSLFRQFLNAKGSGTVEAYPEHDALWFYLLNHAKAEVALTVHPAQPLGKYLPLVEKYYDVVPAKALRAFYYLLLICAREGRHASYTDSVQAQIKTKFPGVLEYESCMTGKSPSGATDYLLKYPPDIPVTTFASGLLAIFESGSFAGGFGGNSGTGINMWAKITKVLVEFVSGETSLEVLLDNVWTLSHNNGPIFNKGMLYREHSSYLIRILDVQRSGQIPQYIVEGAAPSSYVDADLKATAKLIASLLPNLNGYVDWYKVEALGGIHTYTKEKASQVAKHGPSVYASKAEKDALEQANKAKAIAKEALAKEAKEKVEFAQNHYEVSPGVFVKTINRGVAA